MEQREDKPDYARQIADVVELKGGKPTLQTANFMGTGLGAKVYTDMTKEYTREEAREVIETLGGQATVNKIDEFLGQQRAVTEPIIVPEYVTKLIEATPGQKEPIGWIHGTGVTENGEEQMTIALDKASSEIYNSLPEDEKAEYAAEIIGRTADKHIKEMGGSVPITLPKDFPSVSEGKSPALDFVSALMNRKDRDPFADTMFHEGAAVRRIEDSRGPRRAPEGPLGTNARIANRMRGYDIYEPEDGISRWWKTKMNELRTFHILPDQRFGLGFGAELLQNGPPYDLQRLMFPFEEFAIACDGDWVDSAHECTEKCNHPEGALPETSLHKPEGYIVRGSYETKMWKLYERYMVRNEDRDLEYYSAAELNLKEGTIKIMVGQPTATMGGEIGHTYRVQQITSHTVNFIVNFVLILNHNEVVMTKYERGMEPGRPISRPQRKAVNYNDKRDHYKIYLPDTLSYRKIATESSLGKKVKVRCEHDVRGYKRRDKHGRKRIEVRSYRRCVGNGGYHMADYDAANVGMQGKKPD